MGELKGQIVSKRVCVQAIRFSFMHNINCGHGVKGRIMHTAMIPND